jgi:hypothetical protein
MNKPEARIDDIVDNGRGNSILTHRSVQTVSGPRRVYVPQTNDLPGTNQTSAPSGCRKKLRRPRNGVRGNMFPPTRSDVRGICGPQDSDDVKTNRHMTILSVP